MVAAKCGAKVILSDREGDPRLQENLRKSCEMNVIPIGLGNPKKGMVLRIMAISWGVFSPDLLELEPQDIILASDCFYDTKGIKQSNSETC